MATTDHDHTMRPRTQHKSTAAAIPARIEETCIPENAIVLMAAPPVENSTAAAITRRRGLTAGAPVFAYCSPFSVFSLGPTSGAVVASGVFLSAHGDGNHPTVCVRLAVCAIETTVAPFRCRGAKIALEG